MPEFNPGSMRDRRYTIAICKGAGLVDETRQLISHWRPGEEVKAFVQRVQAEDHLGRYTAYRARDIALSSICAVDSSSPQIVQRAC